MTSTWTYTNTTCAVYHVFLFCYYIPVWHFILCHVSNEMLLLLLDKLKQSAPSRIVNVSSVAHKLFGPLDLANLNSEKSVTKQSWYSHSKLALILFTRELSRRLQGSGLLLIYTVFQKSDAKIQITIFNSDKIYRSYSDFYFGVTFLEHTVVLFIGFINCT